MTTIHDLGELGLLERIKAFCPDGVVGDDAAVVALPPGQRLVVTTDVLVDGVHFSDRTTSPFDVGWRAAAANLSDLAAMGADTLGITVGLSLPGATAVDWVEGLYQGMTACLKQFGGEIFGGDLCRSDTITVAITALGAVPPERALYRHAAQPGQVIVATGYHGLSRAGLEVLLNPETWAAVPEAVREQWIRAHRQPTPRFDVVARLRQIAGENLAGIPVAAMDSSDGLANAVMQLCQDSGVGAQLMRSELPISAELMRWAGEERAIEWALYGGEDFELVLCLAENLARPLVEHLGKGAAIVGQVIEGAGVSLVGVREVRSLTSAQEFQHF